MNLTDKLHLIKVEDKNISNTKFCGHDYPQAAECGIYVLLGQWNNYPNISEPCYILDYVESYSRRILGAHCPVNIVYLTSSKQMIGPASKSETESAWGPTLMVILCPFHMQ